jgi:hypothetical protein
MKKDNKYSRTHKYGEEKHKTPTAELKSRGNDQRLMMSGFALNFNIEK